MTGRDQESRSIEIWAKVLKRLDDEVPNEVYSVKLEPLIFLGTSGSVARFEFPLSQGDWHAWVKNTFGKRISQLWREEDDSISELEIVPQEQSSLTAAQIEELEQQRRAAATKLEQSWVAAVQKARERGRIETQIDAEPIRKQLGKIGVWSRTPYFGPAETATEWATVAEELGDSASWIPGFAGGHIFERCAMPLAATSNLTIGTSIVNIWRHPPAECAEETKKLQADSSGRFLLGLGASHKGLVGDDYDKISPLAKMRGYLEELAAEGLPGEDCVLGAFGPKMLELGAKRTTGGHPYLVTAEYTAAARVMLGEGPLLAPEVAVILESDPDKARAIAREFITLYLRGPNYANNMYRLGYTVEDFTAEGGDISDRLIDALVPWGDPETIAAKVRAHLDAGADHVGVQSWGPKPEVDVWRELAPVLLD